MAVFELTGQNGEVFEVEAPDEAAAVSAFQQMQAPEPPAFKQALTPSADVPEFNSAGTPTVTLGDDITQAVRDAPQPGEPNADMFTGALDRFTNSATLGFGDELSALEDAVLGRKPGGGMFDLFNYGDQSFTERRDAALDFRREARKNFARDNPNTAMGADLAGALGLGLALPGSTLATAPRAATTGAGLAFTQGFGEGEDTVENRLERGVAAAPLGFVLGGLGQKLGAGFDRLVSSRAGRAVQTISPTLDELRTTAQGFYRQAKDQGVIFTAQAMDDLVSRLQGRMASMAARPGTANMTFQEFNALAATRGQHATFEGLESFRQGFTNVLQSAPPGSFDRKMAGALREEIDRFIETADPAKVLTGNTPVASEAYKKGRELWRLMKRGETIQRAIEKAVNAAEAGNTTLDQAIRSKFRTLADRIADGRLRGFGKEDLDAIRDVIKGGSLDPLLRIMRGQQMPRLGGLVTAGGAFATMDPLTAALFTAGQQGTSKLAARGLDKATSARAESLATAIRSGTLPSPSRGGPAATLAARASAAGSTETPGLAAALLGLERQGQAPRRVPAR